MTVTERYYTALENKDVDGIKECLHEEVRFVSPLAVVEGKEAVAEAAANFARILVGFEFQLKVEDEHNTMCVYEATFPEPVGKSRAAALLGFRDGLICSLDLFYDSRPLVQHAEVIFGKGK